MYSSDYRDNYWHFFISGIIVLISSIYFIGIEYTTIVVVFFSIGAFFVRHINTLILFYSSYLPLEEIIIKYFPYNLYILFKYFFEPLFFVILICLIIKNISTGSKWKKTPIDIPLLILLLSTIYSGLSTNVSLKLYILGVRPILRYVVVFLLITQSNFHNEKNINTIIRIIYYSAIIQIIIGIIQFFGGGSLKNFFDPRPTVIGSVVISNLGTTITEEGYLISGTLGRSAPYAMFVAFFIITTISKSIKNGLNIVNKNDIVIFTMAIMTLIASSSRKAWLGLSIACLIYILIISDYRKKITTISAIIWLLALLFLCNSIISDFLGNSDYSFTNRLKEIFSYQYIEHSIRYSRGFAIFTVCVEIAKNYLFTGLGPGRAGSSVTGSAAGTSALIQEYNAISLYGPQAQFVSDVGFAAIFAQFGLIAFISILTIFGLVFYTSIIRQKKFNNNGNYKLINKIIIGFSPLMFIGNIGGFSLTYRVISWYWWIFCALLFSSKNEK